MEKQREIKSGEKKQRIILITGMKGSGKSSLIKMELLQNYSRVLIVDFRDEYAETNALPVSSLDEIAKIMKKYAVYRMRLTNDAIFPDVAEFCYKIGNLCLVIEEIPRVLPTSNEKLTGPLADIVFRGRHSNIDLIGATQRSSMININLRSQADEFCIFRQLERQDVKVACDMADIDDKQMLKNLAVGDYLKIDFNGVEKKSVTKLKKLLHIN
jgi:hypothetical protein